MLSAQPLGGEGKRSGTELVRLDFLARGAEKKGDKSHQLSESKRKLLKKKNLYTLSTLVTANFCCLLAGSYKISNFLMGILRLRG